MNFKYDPLELKDLLPEDLYDIDQRYSLSPIDQHGYDTSVWYCKDSEYFIAWLEDVATKVELRIVNQTTKDILGGIHANGE